MLPVARVKGMIKEQMEVKSISTEACFAVTKATVRPAAVSAIIASRRSPTASHRLTAPPQELLLESMTARAARRMLSESREELSYDDVGAP